jgi:methyltransferase (TIGR00027 family)
VGVAAIRAAEAARADPLFTDPLAPAFARAAETFWTVDRDDRASRRRAGALVLWVRVRTRFLDDVVNRAVADGCRQCVVLGAGLDARAFRLPLSRDLRLFELDLPDLLAFKEEVVHDGGFEPTCTRVVVPTDLAGGWADDLERAGFDRSARSVWLAEGLLTYLTEAAREALVDGVSERAAAGSRFGLTLASAERVAGPPPDPGAVPSKPGDYVALWQSDAPADARAWLGRRGWTVEQFDAVDRAATYGIDVPRASNRAAGRLLDATRA